MTELWWPILIAVAAVVVTQNLMAGHSKGVIEMRSIVVKREEQPGLFWFTFVTEAFFLVGFAALLVDWLLGGPLFGQEFQ